MTAVAKSVPISAMITEYAIYSSTSASAILDTLVQTVLFSNVPTTVSNTESARKANAIAIMDFKE